MSESREKLIASLVAARGAIDALLLEVAQESPPAPAANQLSVNTAYAAAAHA